MKIVGIAAGIAGIVSLGALAKMGGGVPVASSASIDSLPNPTGAGAGEPNLAVGPRGEIILSWFQPADSGQSLQLATYSGGRWSPPSVIRSGTDFFINWADFPSVTVLANGRLAAHWLQRNGKTTYAYGIRIAQSGDGGRTWSTPVTPHRDTLPVEHGFVAMWPEGKGLGAVWLDGRSHDSGHDMHGASGGTMLMGTSIGPDGKLGPERTLDARTCDCCQNAMAMAAAGPVVAYRNRSDDEIRDIYVTRRVNGTWTTGKPVHADAWKINACPVNGPAIDASGRNVAVAWFTGARDTNKVNVAFSSDGGATFGEPIRIDDGEPGGRVDLALLPDGNALVSWLERTGGDVAAVRARRVSRNGRLGESKTIATSSAARASGVPRMVRSGNDIYFAWTVASTPSRVRFARAAASEFR